MKVNDLPLMELFEKLQDAGLPLGIGEYEALLRALQAGFGIPDREALARLCCILWVKSQEEKQIFDKYF
ncbi:MAG: CoxE, partial [Moorea sp. SIO4G2]|nr:CoxE [Moorena sp. SIO4G2]